MIQTQLKPKRNKHINKDKRNVNGSIIIFAVAVSEIAPLIFEKLAQIYTKLYITDQSTKIF